MTKNKMHAGGSVTSIRSRSSTGATYYKPIRKVRTGKEIAEFKKELNINDHEIPLEELVARYSTDIDQGLTPGKAEELLLRNGPNCLIPTATKSNWLVLAEFLFGGFNTLLWICAILTLTGYLISFLQDPKSSKDTLYLAVMLVSVIIFTGFFGFYQDYSNTTIMESFKKMIPKYATVIRGGNKLIIPSEELVVGDVVEVKAGNMIPADIRIIESINLKVDNSSITGESMPVPRSSSCTDSDPLETANLAFYTSVVVEGLGRGVVIQCGDQTVIGNIAGLTSGLVKSESIIHKEVKYFVRVLTLVSLVISLIFFTISLLMGYNFFKSLTFFIAILVANVPEGLPVTLTACMTLSAKKMARKNCLVKKLEGMETLGSCNVICSDKTGTLTQNNMTASHLHYDGKEFEVLSSLEEVDEESEAYDALCLVAILCSTATFLDRDLETPIINRKCIGDASESAILKIMEGLVGEVEEKRKKYPKVCEIPFNSVNKYQVSIHRLGNGRFIMVMKGAPESILEKCSTVILDGKTLNLDSNVIKSIKKSILYLSNKGERVLAFADLHLPISFDRKYKFNALKPNFPLTDLRFVGMISLIDPPRPSVHEAVAKCKSAGIRVIMVTGDHPVTAAAIAKKVGIITHQGTSLYDIQVESKTSREKPQTHAAVITGQDLREMSEEDLELSLQIYKEIVFARTSPQQKLKIVEALQRLGMVVAVTGDGVNDSPALKRADIGIAMGITGSDVSKDAADMILLDDNFASIVTGIEEGRLIFDNLKKSIAFVLTSNVPEIVPFMMLVLFNIPEALSVMSILVINVGTDLWPAISLAYENAEADIMKKNPRNPKKDKLINHKLIYLTYGQIGMMQACASFSSYFFIMARHGFFWEKLIGLRAAWENPDLNNLEDSYGGKWTYKERELLSNKCFSGYFLSIVITQIADLLICKTRRLSIFQQGMTNPVLNAGIMFTIILAGLVVYCPGVNTALKFEPISLVSILPTLPYALIILVYDELRKLLIRKYPHGFVDKETYY